MNDKWEILHGDALKLLGGFAPGTFDAAIGVAFFIPQMRLLNGLKDNIGGHL